MTVAFPDPVQQQSNDSLLQNEQAASRIVFEIGEANGVLSDNALDCRSGAIACLQQDHLRRCAPGDAQVRVVLVFGQERELICLGVFLYDRIGSAAQIGESNVN